MTDRTSSNNGEDAPVTRHDLDEALRNAVQQITEQTREFVRDAQTEILRGFETFQTIEHTKIRKLQADLSNLDANVENRLTAVEKRLFEIEKKLASG